MLREFVMTVVSNSVVFILVASSVNSNEISSVVCCGDVGCAKLIEMCPVPFRGMSFQFSPH